MGRAHRVRGIYLRALVAGAVAGGAAACTAAPPLVPGATATAPIPSAVLATATPIPCIVLLGVDARGVVTSMLEGWAAARGWQLVSQPAGEDASADIPPGSVAWVSFGEPTGAVVVEFPGVIVEGPQVGPGDHLSTIGGAGTRYDQAAFLVGVMAGLGSRTGVVGLVEETGGVHEQVLSQAFVQGLRYGCPRCRLVRQPAAAASVETLASEGVDVLFTIAGPAAAGVWERLAVGSWQAVWVGDPPPAVAPQSFVGGVAYAPEALIVPALEAVLAGEPGREWPYAVETKGLRLEGLNDTSLSPGRVRLLEAAWEALVAGELDIGVDPATGELR